MIRRLGAWLFISLNLLIFLYLFAPIVVLIGAAFNDQAYMAFPPKGFSFRWFANFFHNAVFTESLWTSIYLGVAASVLALVLGTLAAYGIERLPGGWRGSLTAFFNGPLQIPTIVLGIALLQLFNSLGIARSFGTLLASHLILCLPYVVRTVAASLYRFDRTVEEAALTLGAPGPRVFWEITFPLLRPSLVAGAIFSFVVSFGNLAVSMFLTSSRITTLPIRVYGYVQYSPDPTIAAISTVIIIVTLIVMYFVERLVGLDRMV